MSEKPPTPPGLHEGSNYPSPFTRIIALGYYDGPKEGFAQCSETGQAYYFKCVGTDEEANEEVWVFTLAPVPAPDLSGLIDLYSQYHAPRWPEWVPIWKFPTKDIQKAVDEETECVVARAGRIQWVIAARVSLLSDVLAARRLSPGDMESITDWFTFLGLSKAIL